MRRATLLLAALAVVGCSAPADDPTNSVLKPGVVIVMSSEKGQDGYVLSKDNKVVAHVAPGTRATVGHDPGFYQEPHAAWVADAKDRGEDLTPEQITAGPPKLTPPHPDATHRQIDIVIESGPAAGVSGHVPRKEWSAIP